MKIEIHLNQESIKAAIQNLNEKKAVLTEKMIPEFMMRSAQWIIKRANEILYSSDIGVSVVQDIASKWEIEVISPSHIKLFNSSYKASFVEFGVGIIGEQSEHPNASVAGYEYNVESDYKNSDGYWSFTIPDQSELDLPKDAVAIKEYVDNKGLKITTNGAKGLWFLFNAVEDFKIKEKNRLWEEIKSNYFG